MAIHFIQPGRPVRNGYIESLDEELRDDCLHTSGFTDLQDAKHAIEAWRLDDNAVRRHSRLGQPPPATYVADGS